MKLFKKGKATAKAASTETLQDYQKEFNQVLFNIGSLTYQKHMAQQSLNQLNEQLQSQYQKADQLGEDAAKVRARIQEEMAATAKAANTGTTDEKAS